MWLNLPTSFHYIFIKLKNYPVESFADFSGPMTYEALPGFEILRAGMVTR